jgi:CHASE2 domain-containing sensor protein
VTDADPQPAAPPPSPARAVALYTTLRLLVFLLSWLVLVLLGLRGFLAPLAAVLVSSVVSYLVLRPQRDDVARAMAARAERGADTQARRRRLDGDAP